MTFQNGSRIYFASEPNALSEQVRSCKEIYWVCVEGDIIRAEDARPIGQLELWRAMYGR